MSTAASLAARLAALEVVADRSPAGARDRARLVDETLAALFAEAGAPAGVALLALGGYGRGSLHPYSDVDLLLLHDEAVAADEVASLAEGIFYPLWDAGLTLGHNVRTVAQCVAEGRARLDVCTAMLDARRLAGDEVLADAMVLEVVAVIREEPRAFAEQLRASCQERHARFPAVSKALECDLKEGAGGLRDAHVLGWLAIALGGEDLEALVDAQLLAAREAEEVVSGAEFLGVLRGSLHRDAGRPGDRLVADLHADLAEALGFEDEEALALSAGDALVRRVLLAGRWIEGALHNVFVRLLDGDDAVRTALSEPAFATFADAAEANQVLSASVMDALAVESEPEPELFLRVLESSPGGPAMLETMDRLGVLQVVLPEVCAVRARPQRDPFHRLPVDGHLRAALAAMGGLLHESGAEPRDAMAASAAELLRERDLATCALLGAFLHDIGKVGQGAHVPIGAEIAATVAARLDLPAAHAELVTFLVEHHLLLADTATRRDLEDESLVLSTAAVIGDAEHLAALYLLTLADATSTGPHASTPWRWALIRELVVKVQHAFDRGEVGSDTAARLAERTAAIRDTLINEPPARVERFLASLPPAYIQAIPPETIATHYPLVSAHADPHEVRIAVTSGDQPGTYALSVACQDRPGLLSKIAGALALHGCSILTAQVFTTDDEMAIDVFEVEGAFEPTVEPERWEAFRVTLRQSLEGRLSLDHRVQAKRANYPAPRADIAVEIRIDNDASDFFSVIEIGCADRLGLLFDLTRALAQLDLDVHLAKVATYGGRVVDAFYVRTSLGTKIEDEAHAREIVRAIEARLEGGSAS